MRLHPAGITDPKAFTRRRPRASFCSIYCGHRVVTRSSTNRCRCAGVTSKNSCAAPRGLGLPSRRPLGIDDVAEGWLRDGQRSTDGVVAKRLDGPYEPGERAMIKVKRLRTADCVVGGFRYGSGSRQVGSLLLGLYNEAGQLDHVGFTSAISVAERPALTRQLEALRKPPGFTGRAPGGPSRWSTERSGEWEPLAPNLVVEVRFDHVTAGRFRHGTKLVRWRPDKDPRQCTYEQIALGEISKEQFR